MDLPHVRIGAPVTVSLLAYPDHPFTGTVDWISGALDPTTRTAKVRCVIRNPQHLLRPEMYGTVTIETDGQAKLAAPRSAIVRLGDQMVAYVDRGRAPNGSERFERRAVAIDDAEAGRYVPIVSGLAPGERVVTSGALILSGESS
jgi:multidrug efflux pump subunit AcrA (membrane-fusion protein)